MVAVFVWDDVRIIEVIWPIRETALIRGTTVGFRMSMLLQDVAFD